MSFSIPSDSAPPTVYSFGLDAGGGGDAIGFGPSTPGAAKDSGAPRILIVEDDSSIREAVQIALAGRRLPRRLRRQWDGGAGPAPFREHAGPDRARPADAGDGRLGVSSGAEARSGSGRHTRGRRVGRREREGSGHRRAGVPAKASQHHQARRHHQPRARGCRRSSAHRSSDGPLLRALPPGLDGEPGARRAPHLSHHQRRPGDPGHRPAGRALGRTGCPTRSARARVPGRSVARMPHRARSHPNGGEQSQEPVGPFTVGARLVSPGRRARSRDRDGRTPGRQSGHHPQALRRPDSDAWRSVGVVPSVS